MVTKYNMKKQYVTFIFTLVLTLILIQSASAILGTFEKETDIELIQTCNNCTYCNISSVKYPNGTVIFANEEMTRDKTYYNFTLNSSYTKDIGTYKYYYDCGNTLEKATGGIIFEVTLSGDETPEGISYILAVVIIIIFGIACVFLYLSNLMQEPGPKIFFMLASFVFMIGSLSLASVIAWDSNLTQGINTSLSVMLFAFGFITIVVFAYIMIKQTIAAVDLMRINKGYEMDY